MFPVVTWLARLRVSRNWGVVEGTPIRVGERTIVPLGRTMSLSFRGPRGLWGVGVASTQPVAVRVEGPQGVQLIPIRDLTRRIIMLISIGSIAVSLVVRLALARRRRQSIRPQQMGLIGRASGKTEEDSQ